MGKNFTYRKTVISLLFFLLLANLNAQNRWEGTKSNDWNDPDNWSMGILPNSGHDIEFDGANPCLLTGSHTVRSVVFNGPGPSSGSLVIDGGGQPYF